MKKFLIITLTVLIVLGGGGYLLAQRADAAEPGDLLYTVDILAENIERTLTFDDIKNTELETVILEERVEELENLLATETDVDLDEVLSEVSVQQDRVRECMGTLEADGNQYQNGELEQIQNQYQQQLEQHIEVMEQVQNQGEDSALQVKEKLEENLEQCGDGTCGSTNDENSSGNGNNDNGSGNQNKGN